MALSEDDITRAVARAREAAGGSATWQERAPRLPARDAPPAGGVRAGAMGVFATLEECVRAAKTAFGQFREYPLQRRERMIDRMRIRLREHVDELARGAVQETGLGRVEDKLTKNRLVIDKTPGPEILRPESQSGDHGLMLTEWAPYGIIGAITPVTNPSETIINNAISMLSAGNCVVFNPHPTAKGVSARTVSIMNAAAQEEGAPANLLTAPVGPSIETAQALMAHRDIRLLVVTGGPAVVRAALDSGKKCITAGPGNPPSVVDETACISRAARSITLGASLDNGIICTAEKLVIAVAEIHDRLVDALREEGNYVLRPSEFEAVEKIVFEELRGPRRRARIRRELIGKTPQHILARAGIRVPESCRLAIACVDNDHPLLWTEQMMPVLPVTAAPDAESAMRLAVEMEGGNRHTFTMHSRRVDRLSKMARMCDASIFVKNGPNFAGLGGGGEGPTSFTIATPTGEGLTDARSFSRRRRCTLVDDFRIV